MGALNSWNSKGTMYIKTPGMFAEGTHGMNAGGAALHPSAPGGLGYPRPAVTKSMFVPIDDELQGDCVCDQPWTGLCRPLCPEQLARLHNLTDVSYLTHCFPTSGAVRP